MHQTCPDGTVYELATTRRVPKAVTLPGFKFPCVVVHRGCLEEALGEVLAGVFRQYAELRHHRLHLYSRESCRQAGPPRYV